MKFSLIVLICLQAVLFPIVYALACERRRISGCHLVPSDSRKCVRRLFTHEQFEKWSSQSWFLKLIIQELRVSVLTKRHMGSRNDIQLKWCQRRIFPIPFERAQKKWRARAHYIEGQGCNRRDNRSQVNRNLSRLCSATFDILSWSYFLRFWQPRATLAFLGDYRFRAHIKHEKSDDSIENFNL